MILGIINGEYVMYEEVNSENRIIWIDNAKAIGIILVVVGHAFRDNMRTAFLPYDYIYNLIYFFHMPLFFMISGYLLERSKNKTRAELLKSKVRTILVPFMTYTILLYIVVNFMILLSPKVSDLFTSAFGKKIEFIKYIYLSLVGNNPYSFHLWFLICLFIMEAFAILIKIDKRKIWIIFIIFLFISISWSPVLNNLGLEYNIYTVNVPMSNFIFFVTGQILYINKNKINFNVKKLILLLSLGLLIFNVYYICDFDSICTIFDVSYEFVLLIGKLSLIFFTIGMATKIKDFKILSYIGRRSMGIYLLHQPLCCAILGYLLYDFWNFPAIVVIMVCFVFSFVLPILFICICNKNPKIAKLVHIAFNI